MCRIHCEDLQPHSRAPAYFIGGKIRLDDALTQLFSAEDQPARSTSERSPRSYNISTGNPKTAHPDKLWQAARLKARFDLIHRRYLRCVLCFGACCVEEKATLKFPNINGFLSGLVS